MEFLLLIVVGVLGYAVQARLNSVFSKYSKVPARNGLTGGQIAEKMLHDNGIYDVKITHVSGKLTDHYNPANKTVNLSDSVYNSYSIAAQAVACHECGHAVQHAEQYFPVMVRSALVPITNFASTASTWVIIIGIILLSSIHNPYVFYAGIGLLCISALFSIVTLPVEYNASQRAMTWLTRERMMPESEMEAAQTSLKWAARTYLVAALSAIATIIYYLGFARNRD